MVASTTSTTSTTTTTAPTNVSKDELVKQQQLKIKAKFEEYKKSGMGANVEATTKAFQDVGARASRGAEGA